MTTAPPLKTEGTRLGQCVQGAPSTGIWSLAIEHGVANRGYRAIRGARESRIESKKTLSAGAPDRSMTLHEGHLGKTALHHQAQKYVSMNQNLWALARRLNLQSKVGMIRKGLKPETAVVGFGSSDFNESIRKDTS